MFPEKVERFVHRTPGCWLWTGRTFGGPRKYPQIHLTGRGKVYVHRLSYEVHVGPIPDGMQVCHKCDNVKCVRPDHLFAGTARDNVHDASRKGRLRTGERNPASKLTATQVAEIRALYRDGRGPTQAALGARFGVSGATIGRIAQGRIWTGAPIGQRRLRRFSNAPRPMLSRAQENEIAARYAAGGCTHRSLAAEYGCSHGVISAVVHGQRRGA